MKFSADRKTFEEALKTASACVPRRAMLPMLSNALFEVENGNVLITCLNLEQRISVSFPADIKAEGKTSLPALKLLNLLSKLTGDMVTVDSNVDNHYSNISCGSTCMSIAGLAPDDYPGKMETKADVFFTIDAKELADLLSRGGYAVSLDDSRKALTGVLFDFDGNGLSIVSTDSKRLAIAEYSGTVATDTPKQFVVPVAAVSMLKKLKGTVDFDFGENAVTVKAGDVELQSKLIQLPFPNYKRIIPTNLPEKVELNAEEFLQKLALISVMVTAEDSSVNFSFGEEKVKLTAGSADGKIEDEMRIVSRNAFVNPVVHNLNPAFLTAAVSACGEGNFRVSFDAELKPIVFDFANNSKAIVMPINKK